jgi:8-oxo-dGTP diphosphatase
MENRNPRAIVKSVTAAIIFNNDCVLLTRRKSGENLEGYWEFPGGKIEGNETPQECLERELFEELGVHSKAEKILVESIYSYKNGTIKLIGIKTDLIDNRIVLSVHDKFEWVPIQMLLDYQLAPADIPIAEYIMRT